MKAKKSSAKKVAKPVAAKKAASKPVKKPVASKKVVAKKPAVKAKPAASKSKPIAKPVAKPAAKPVAKASKTAAKASSSSFSIKAAAAKLKSALTTKKQPEPKPAAKKAVAPAPAKKQPVAAVPAKKPATAPVKPVAKAVPAPAPAPKAITAKPAAPAKPKLINRSPSQYVSPKGVLTEDQVRRSPDRDYMSDSQLEFFRHRLLQMRNEVLERELDVKERLHQREVFADPADRATAEEEHWLDLRLRERESLLLHKIDDALRRIAEREFGYCEKTGDAIGIPRLLARPTATVCVDVKGQDERIESQFRDR
jgi:DnaK suppressor protein